MEFPETCWTALAQATLRGGPAERAALEALCRDYWRPVNLCIRGRGAPSERADDLTQEFFLHLMQTGAFRRADPEKGRFRSFLLGALRYFLADDARHQASQRAGGHLQRCELDEESAVTHTEETQFDREWAQAVLDRALARVEAEALAFRGPDGWRLLRTFLPGSATPVPYPVLAATLRMSENGAKTEVFRLRQKFREAIRREVARTVTTPQEVEDELAHLRAVLQNSICTVDASNALGP